MTVASYRPIDCDVHITVPSMQPLLAHMDDYWRDHLTNRGTDKLNLTLTTQTSLLHPISCWLNRRVFFGRKLGSVRSPANKRKLQ